MTKNKHFELFRGKQLSDKIVLNHYQLKVTFICNLHFFNIEEWLHKTRFHKIEFKLNDYNIMRQLLDGIGLIFQKAAI